MAVVVLRECEIPIRGWNEVKSDVDDKQEGSQADRQTARTQSDANRDRLLAALDDQARIHSIRLR